MARRKERKSSFPMIPVEDAIAKVLCEAEPLEPVTVPIQEAVGRTLAVDVASTDALPPFDASIMDGYAVVASDGAGEYDVVGRITAGCDPQADGIRVEPGKVAYITTGAKMPAGADAVIKIEDTEEGTLGADGKELTVKILKGTEAGKNIRPQGVDIAAGQLLLLAGDVVGPAEVGLLATAGVARVAVSPRPTVGVMSTGDELAEAGTPTLAGGQIRDSNRAMLLALLGGLGARAVDLGIVQDKEEEAGLRRALGRALELGCDAVVTSGGVSMGEADLLKSALGDLGQIHFGRLAMKPGKPTTFATIGGGGGGGGGRRCLVFALPGNPVSAAVTAHLLVAPALKRLSGRPPAACQPAQVEARLAAPAALDPERPEYHRARIAYSAAQRAFVAESTGSQLSSRLLSMKSANALLCIPRGAGVLPRGHAVAALLIGELPSPAPADCFHRKAAEAAAEEPEAARQQGGGGAPPVTSRTAGAPGSAGGGAGGGRRPGVDEPQPEPARRWAPGRRLGGLCGAAPRWRRARRAPTKGTRPLLAQLLTAPGNPFACEVAFQEVVPDEPKAIQERVKRWADAEGVDLIVTSGGTGFGPRDTTPEAVAPLLHREAPGLVFALMKKGTEHTPLAVLSRPVAGTRGRTLVFTVPGSSKAVKENMEVMIPLIPRICNLLSDRQC
ncbi:unnamed protein product [Heterosigma akashiwo]